MVIKKAVENGRKERTFRPTEQTHTSGKLVCCKLTRELSPSYTLANEAYVVALATVTAQTR
jgi:hypothetical protein